ncbi:MAG TPA: restriction endonuclease subunit R [Runella sp.]|nr:restriction endonuclease subunit R [Runella sp.]HAO49285.1 restriction endonuclease subunit R [Runella sp.]
MFTEDNPILNNPYQEPRYHYATDLDGNLNYSLPKEGRRIFKPDSIAMPTQRADGQLSLIEVNDFREQYGTHLINLLRNEVGNWRKDSYPNTTRVTKELLNFWFCNPDREVTKQLFFAQREAIETAIWLNEVAERSNAGTSVLKRLYDANAVSKTDVTQDLPRIAFKMATGTGKTVVMASLILYHFLNRQAYRNDSRFADYFLLVAPGITIKDRLGVLRVNETQNRSQRKDYYFERSLVPIQYEESLGSLNSRLAIINYHAFEPRTVQGNKRSPFDGKIGPDGKKQEEKEQFTQTLRRIARNFKFGSRLLLINDEAHHCYLPIGNGKTKSSDDEDPEENERAAVWYRGIIELAKRFKLQQVYDLSATPYFLSGSGYDSYSLFPWIVTDFGLTEAIESGLVKIPFLPERDNTQHLDMPVLRNLYEHIKKDLPNKRKKIATKENKSEKTIEGKPQLPETLELALKQFYGHYAKDYERITNLFGNPPVFIVVCSNTNVSKEVFKYLAGFQNDNGHNVSSSFDLFTNFDRLTGAPLRRPPSLLIDSAALEAGEQIDDDFKKIFAPEIEKFKQDYRILHPDRSIEKITEAELLREVVNTVGRTGALGAHIRCVVSVSMLTEGWDANTVTHIVGIRAFKSTLLCEQVAGRALRRKHYYLQAYDQNNNPIEHKDVKRYKPENVTYKFPPEYAQIIGVPFKLFKGGKNPQVAIPRPPKHIYSLPERKQLEIVFPNVTGYRIETNQTLLKAEFETLDDFYIDGSAKPYETTLSTAFSGNTQKIEVNLSDIREQEIIYHISRELMKSKFSDEGVPNLQRFNQVKKIVHHWYETKVKAIGLGTKNADFKKAVIYENTARIVEHIYRGIELGTGENERVLPVFNFYKKTESTSTVNGFTTREVYATRKSPVNFVVADTESWEQRAAKTLEDMPEVTAYVKNAFLGFQIPYTKANAEKGLYEPDFIAKCLTPSGKAVNLIIEITGMNQDKQTKRHAVEKRWLPAVNALKDKYDYGEWHFVEVTDNIQLSDIKQVIQTKLKQVA